MRLFVKALVISGCIAGLANFAAYAEEKAPTVGENPDAAACTLSATKKAPKRVRGAPASKGEKNDAGVAKSQEKSE